MKQRRVLTDSAEFNRVLGGGIVSGSLVLQNLSSLSQKKNTIYYWRRIA